ncbi:NADPH-dependent F420 reductase [Promicromonospora sp. NPDC019610]|uniref:NADPH-dependent F420 reductase n=1 Tax=Promicromonospora sp. NPDC019610 TaxID=3364405 RepID=UPI0037B71468
MSSITLIGTGNMARAIGTLAVAGGNTVEVMGRDQAKADALATALGSGTTAGTWGAVPAGDIVITALLADGVVPVVTEYGDALAGKVIVDISNPFNATFDGLAHGGEETSIAQEVATVAPAGAAVVKAFNTIFRNVLEQGRPGVFIAGDDAQAKADVAAFVESLGLRPLDVGGLRMAHWLEGMGLITVSLAGNGVGHWDFALGVDEFTG